MITQHTKYGLKALLALARRYSQGELTNIAEIAKEEHIPAKFLELIMLDLKNQGWLHSKRGPRGGYTLTKPPTKILLGDVFRQMEGPLAPVPCARGKANALCEDCGHKRECGVRMVMREVRNAMAAVMDKTTLQDLLDGEATERAHEDAAMYYI